MLAKVGVKKDALTYDAFTDKTKERLRRMQKQRSTGQLGASTTHGKLHSNTSESLLHRPALCSEPVSDRQPSTNQKTAQPVPEHPSSSSSSAASTPEQNKRNRSASYASSTSSDSPELSPSSNKQPEQILTRSTGSPQVSSRLENRSRRRATGQTALVIRAPSVEASKAALDMAQKPLNSAEEKSTDDGKGEEEENTDDGKRDQMEKNQEMQALSHRPDSIPIAVLTRKDSCSSSSEVNFQKCILV